MYCVECTFLFYIYIPYYIHTLHIPIELSRPACHALPVTCVTVTQHSHTTQVIALRPISHFLHLKMASAAYGTSILCMQFVCLFEF